MELWVQMSEGVAMTVLSLLCLAAGAGVLGLYARVKGITLFARRPAEEA